MLALGLAGCASRAPEPTLRPVPLPMPAPAPAAPPAAAPDIWQQPLADFERQHRDLAANAARQGDWVASQQALEVVLALRPTDSVVRAELARAEQMASAGAAQRLEQAKAAQRKGESGKALRLYLDVLALSPDNTEAAQALRALERERVQRQHLGQLSRNYFTRAPTMPAMPRRDASAGAGRTEIEHASLLASQGETKGAIAVLLPLATSSTPDSAARSMLADLYVRQAEESLPSDRGGAVQALQRSLQLEPRHARASALLKSLQRGDGQGTKAVPATPAGQARR